MGEAGDLAFGQPARAQSRPCGDAVVALEVSGQNPFVHVAPIG